MFQQCQGSRTRSCCEHLPSDLPPHSSLGPQGGVRWGLQLDKERKAQHDYNNVMSLVVELVCSQPHSQTAMWPGSEASALTTWSLRIT